jgi:hypothetical protein
MDAVQKIANEVVSSSEEAVIQGEQLHKLAHQLEESVRGFNLDGQAAPETAGVVRAELPARVSPTGLTAARERSKPATGGRREDDRRR